MLRFSHEKAWFRRGRAFSWNFVLWLDSVLKYVHVYLSYVSIRNKHPTRMRRRHTALIGQFPISPLLRLVLRSEFGYSLPFEARRFFQRLSVHHGGLEAGGEDAGNDWPYYTKNCTRGWFARTDFQANTSILALIFQPSPDIPSNVGFQAWDCSTWPCGREGELNPRAAMCDAKGRGAEIRELNASV